MFNGAVQRHGTVQENELFCPKHRLH